MGERWHTSATRSLRQLSLRGVLLTMGTRQGELLGTTEFYRARRRLCEDVATVRSQPFPRRNRPHTLLPNLLPNAPV